MLSQVLCGEFLLSGVFIDRRGEFVEVTADGCGHGGVVEDVAEAGTEQSGVCSGEEQGQVQAVICNVVSMGSGDAFDEAVVSQPS